MQDHCNSRYIVHKGYSKTGFSVGSTMSCYEVQITQTLKYIYSLNKQKRKIDFKINSNFLFEEINQLH